MSSPQPRNRPKPNAPGWAIAIASRRRELGLRQSDVEEESGWVVKQSSVSDMERGEYPPTSMTTERLNAYLKALRWTPQEFIAATGLAFPGVTGQATLQMPTPGLEAKGEVGVVPDPLEQFRYTEGFEYYPLYTSASAGTGEREIIDDEVVGITKAALRKRGITSDRKHEAMPIKVNGNCLVSQNVRFSTRNVSHGDVVFVHLGAPPQDGDRVCCYDHSDNQLIIKFYKEQQDPSFPNLVTLYDAIGNQYVRNVTDLDYKGVVFHRSGDL